MKEEIGLTTLIDEFSRLATNKPVLNFTNVEGIEIVKRIYQFGEVSRKVLAGMYCKDFEPIFKIIDEEYVRQRIRYSLGHTTFEEEMKVTALIDIVRWKVAYSVSRLGSKRPVHYLDIFVAPMLSPWCAFTLNVMCGKCDVCPLVASGLCGEGKHAEDNFFYRCSVAYPPIASLIYEIKRKDSSTDILSNLLVLEAKKQMEFPDAGRVLQHYGFIKL